MLSGVRLKEKVKPFAKTIAGFAHPYRLAILYLLAHDSLRVRDLSDELALPQNLVSHHVKIMSSGGVLWKERIGKNVFYNVSEKAFRTKEKEMKKFLSDTPFFRQFFSGREGD